MEYGRHRFAWYGFIPKTEYRSGFHGREDINTYLANQTFRSLFPGALIPEGLDFLNPNDEHPQVTMKKRS